MIRRFLKFIPIVFATILVVTRANAWTRDELQEPFDPRELTSAEIRFLQTGLAFHGEYDGMIDGKWGRASTRALVRFVEKYDLPISSDIPRFAVAGLGSFTNSVLRAGGWTRKFFPNLNISFLVPSYSEKNRARLWRDNNRFFRMENKIPSNK